LWKLKAEKQGNGVHKYKETEEKKGCKLRNANKKTGDRKTIN
jgi:hypothetical protein